MISNDALSLLSQHHFEFAIPLALLAYGIRSLAPEHRARIMPVFFGVALSPLFALSVLRAEAFGETFPAYLSNAHVFELSNPIWAALYMPGWGACALLAAFHPLLADRRFARPLLWLSALALACYQASLFLADSALR